MVKSLFLSSMLAAVTLSAEPVQAAARPIAAVFTCSSLPDTPEKLFDRRPGELFVVQGGGTAARKANVEFAVGAYGVPLIVVLGGESCSQAGLGSKDAVLQAVAGMRRDSATVRQLEAAGDLQVAGAVVDKTGHVTFLAAE